MKLFHSKQCQYLLPEGLLFLHCCIYFLLVWYLHRIRLHDEKNGIHIRILLGNKGDYFHIFSHHLIYRIRNRVGYLRICIRSLVRKFCGCVRKLTGSLIQISTSVI